MIVFLVLFTALTALEVYLFAIVGTLIGGWGTVGLTFLTAIIGIAFVQYQGITTALKAYQKIHSQEKAPLKEMYEGLCIALAGICLVFPGFATDAFGALLLIPFIRHFLLELLADGALGIFSFGTMNVNNMREETKRRKQQDETIVNADFEVIEDKKTDRFK